MISVKSKYEREEKIIRVPHGIISPPARVIWMTADRIGVFFVDGSSGICYGNRRHRLLYIFQSELAATVTEKDMPFSAVLF